MRELRRYLNFFISAARDAMAEYMTLDRPGKVFKLRRDSRDEDYRRLYRFNRRNVEWLTEHFLGEDSGEKRGGALNNHQRMRSFLRYIGDPGFQSGVGEDIGVHQSTVSRTVTSVLFSIFSKAHLWIKFPTSEEELHIAQLNWREKFNFVNAIGVLDCTHVAIMKPSQHGDEYINRKTFPSINVQATCNEKEIFTSVDSSWPGSTHDSRIWKNSEPFKILRQSSSGALLLGDSGYGISPWLMTPFSEPTTPEEHSFNRCLKRERVIIERCFGQVKRRFPILGNKIRIDLRKVPTMIICCFVLHNVAKHLGDEEFELPHTHDTENESSIESVSYENATDIAIRRNGQLRRIEISRIIHQQLR